ncbi:MAG: PEGA domain-containing protein [Ignavibacteriaceae bacterium]|nr:PEGA domain-containing protein [Ignavibacteriaceae bacterium]
MKKIIAVSLLLLLGMFLASCDSSSTTDPNPVPEAKGSILMISNPVGAQVFFNNVLHGIAPDTIKDVTPGTYSVTLKLTGYKDTTITGIVVQDKILTQKTVSLTSDVALDKFGFTTPVKIYETSGTTASQPSGLDLSTGLAYGISGADKGLVDIYYSTNGTGGNGWLVQSADLNTTNGLIRKTLFQVGASGNIYDAIPSPLKTAGTWTDNMDDREANYVFLYDHDGHYSKIKIVNYGGGNVGDPAWVEVQWLYNKVLGDVRF